MKARWLLEATGAALLLLLPLSYPLIVPGSLSIYHHSLPLTHLVGGLSLDLLSLLILGVALSALLSRLPLRPRQIASGVLTGLVIWSVLYCIVSLLRLHPFGDTNTFPENQPVSFPVLIALYWHRLRFGLLIAIPVFTVALAWMKPDLSSILVRATRLGLAAFAFSALWIVPQLFYLAFNLRESPSFDHTSSQARSIRSRRIVWILLDELSYNLVFDHPPSGQRFPNLQSLRSRSTSLGNIKPVGISTDRIIPSLLAGREIDQIRSTRSRNLLYMNQAQHEWAEYDPNTTLFKLAQTNGWNSGVAGWFNPYCRIFAATLTTCSSEPGIGASFPFEAWGSSEKKSVLSNALVIPIAFLNSFTSHKRGTGSDLIDRDIQDYRSGIAKAGDLIQNGQINFVFVHLPVPHPPGIYNRNTHRLGEGGNYLDNLTLADDTLGVLLKEIDQTPWADQTTVIVSSDHSWRVPLWRKLPDWTSEEERISQGHFDQRPVFLVHFPSQQSGNEVLAPLPELVEHDVIAAMLEGKINNPEDLNSALLAAEPSVLSEVRGAH